MRAVSLSSIVVMLAVAGAAPPAWAVVLLHRPDRNTSAPTGDLALAGWQWQGQFTDYLGTPISSRYFLTAQHIGGSVGQPFLYHGQTYTTDQAIDVPGSDLRLWRVNGTLPSWAPLWNPSTDGDETGRRMFVAGRGTQRGTPVFRPLDLSIASPAPGVNRPREAYERFGESVPGDMELRGWRWGEGDRVQSWGENHVSEAFDAGPGYGRLLYFTFDADGGPNEAHLSLGDSGGGAFVQNAAGQWKLAGINWLVDGPFRDAPASDPYFANLFDAGGFYVSNPPERLVDQSFDIPTGAYASSVAPHLPFILGITGGPSTSSAGSVPEPATAAGLALVAATVGLRRRR